MRKTLQASLVAGALLSLEAEALKSEDRWNWSHNIEFTSKFIEKPSTVQELEELVASTKGSVKVVGTAHSFSDIADTDGTAISLQNFTDVTVDTTKNTVTFGAGTTYT